MGDNAIKTITKLPVLLAIVFTCATVHVCVLIEKSQLEEALCDNRRPTGNVVTTFELESAQVYTIPSGDFCVISNSTNLTIQVNDSSLPATIRCLPDENSSYLSRGFAFLNVTGLTISNVIIENCGAVLTEEVLGQSNSSNVHFGFGEAAALICNNCHNITLSNVTIRNYTGHAFIGIDTCGQSTMESVVITDNVDIHRNCLVGYNTCKGSGIVWMYTNKTENTCADNGSVKFTVMDSEFSDNIGDTVENYETFIRCADDLADSFFSRDTLFEPVGLPSVGAITLINQQTFRLRVSIINTSFIGNRGQCYGAIAALYLSQAAFSSLYLSGCTFAGNGYLKPNSSSLRQGGRYFGSSLTIYMKNLGRFSKSSECLVIENSHFVEGDIASQISLTQFPESTGVCIATLRNIDAGNGRLLYASTLDTGDSFEIYLSNINLIGNQMRESPSDENEYGLLSFSFVTRVTITDSTFQHLNGPIINAEATYIVFIGDVLFSHAVGSTWTNGAVMYLRGESVIWLQEPLNMTLSNSVSFEGGAIYSISRYNEYCPIQFITDDEYNIDNIGDININVTFISNKARIAGNSLYISPLTDCSLRLSTTIDVNTSTVFKEVFHFEDKFDNGLLEISSPPVQVCVCGSNLLDTNRSALVCADDDPSKLNKMYTFPGNVITLSVVAIDERDNRVYSLVYSLPRPIGSNSTETSTFDWHLGYGEDIVQSYGQNCTNLTFSIFSGNVDDEVNGQIEIYASGSTKGLFIPVVLTNCPPGFEIIKGKDFCDCSSFLTEEIGDIHCNISSGLITRPGTAWIGIVEYRQGYKRRASFKSLTARDVRIGYSQYCPTRYCHQTLSQLNVSNSSLCLNGRTGILCGQCKEGLSVTIGSPLCQKCPNWWLFTIFLYAFLGFVIVALLLSLQLTVAQGTINGLIFYANLLSISAYYLFGSENLQWALIFISLLNLEFGFPVCLFDGLNEIIKGILSIVFPLYIWMVSIGFIYASRYSNKISKLTSKSAVPVLATLIHITFYKFLRFSVDGLAFATVEVQTPDDHSSKITVWYYDGSVRYLIHPLHIVLFVMVLVVVCVFIFPYAIVLTGIQFFSRFRIIN